MLPLGLGGHLLFGQGDGQVGPGHVQQVLAGLAVGGLLMDGLLFLADLGLHGLHRVKAAAAGKRLVGFGGVLFGDGVQPDGEFGADAGQLLDLEVLRIGHLHLEGVAGLVAVESPLDGGGQFAAAQHNGGVVVPAVGDGLTVPEALRVKRDLVAPLGRAFGGGVVGVQAAAVGHLLVHGAVQHRADVPGDGQALVLAKGDAGGLVCHSAAPPLSSRCRRRRPTASRCPG